MNLKRLLLLIAVGLLVTPPLAAQNRQTKNAEDPTSYSGKAYNCNGAWQPYPCPEVTPAPKLRYVPPETEPISEEELEYRQKELDKFVAKEKDNLIVQTRNYAAICQKKYNITPRSLNDIETYCKMKQTTIEACRSKLFELETEMALYEKEYRKNHNLPYSPTDRASQTLKNKPKKKDFKF